MKDLLEREREVKSGLASSSKFKEEKRSFPHQILTRVWGGSYMGKFMRRARSKKRVAREKVLMGGESCPSMKGFWPRMGALRRSSSGRKDLKKREKKRQRPVLKGGKRGCLRSGLLEKIKIVGKEGKGVCRELAKWRGSEKKKNNKKTLYWEEKKCHSTWGRRIKEMQGKNLMRARKKAYQGERKKRPHRRHAGRTLFGKDSFRTRR